MIIVDYSSVSINEALEIDKLSHYGKIFYNSIKNDDKYIKSYKKGSGRYRDGMCFAALHMVPISATEYHDIMNMLINK